MNTQLRLKAARENYGAKDAEYRGLLATEGSMTEELRTKIDTVKAELTALDAEVKRFQELEAAEMRTAAANAAGAPASRGEENELNNIVEKYEVRKVLLNAVDPTYKIEGRELEMHQKGKAEQIRAGLSVAGNGIIVPEDVFIRLSEKHTQKRDQTVTGGSSGSEGGVNVQTSVGGIIDVLMPKTIFANLPVQKLAGLTGNVDLPNYSTVPTGTWSTENATATEQTPAWSKISLSPKRLNVIMQLSNQLLMQSSNSIEAFAFGWLRDAVAQKFEAAGIKGGGSNEPIGIIGNGSTTVRYAGGAAFGATSGTHADGFALAWQDIINLIRIVEISNAQGGAFVSNPQVMAALATTSRQSSGVEGNFILPNWGGPLAGYQALTTTLVPSNLTKGSGTGLSALLFGDFSKLMFASWGGIEIASDPYTALKENMTNVVLNSYADIAVLQPTAFAVIKDAIA